jgi:uncharacterized protein (TIGR03437 family)
MVRDLTMLLPVLLFSSAAANAQAPPAIQPEGVINAASQMPSQFPGGAIARGSRFRILGQRLGPEKAAVEGVSVHLRKADSTVAAIPIYASASRIDAILPSSASTGEYSLTINYRGLTSAPFPVKVAQSSFGIFTENGTGWGPATAATVAPGSTVTIRGSGLGPERKPEVLVGGKSVRRIRYAGPGPHHDGEDRIRFDVPRDAPLGCYVPLEVRADGIASNVATIAIAPKGQPCSATAPWLASDSMLLLMRAGLRSGTLGAWTADLLAAGFGISRDTTLAPMRMLPPPGGCTVYSRTLGWDDFTTLTEIRKVDYPDAGWLRVRGPEGERSVARWPRGAFSYWTILGGTSPAGRRRPSPLFLAPGVYSITGPGGRQVGPFRTEITVPEALKWTNRERIETVDRGKDLEFTWKGAFPGDLVVVAATNTDIHTGAMTFTACVAKGPEGHFAIPARLLTNLPVSIGAIFPLNALLLARIPTTAPVGDRVTPAYVSIDLSTVNFR